MKKMMMTLAALCVAGAASAVTAGWTQTYETASNGTVPDVAALTDGSAVTYTFVFDALDTIEQNVHYIKVSQDDGGSPSNASICVTPSGQINGNLNNGEWWKADFSANSVELHTENNVAAIIISRTDGKVSIDFYLNGTMLLSTETGAFYSEGGTSGTFDSFELATGGTIAQYNVALTEQDLDEIYAAVTIPEPTALALLALGVAGLALRRKAA